MGVWFKCLFGTPKRTLVTVAVIALMGAVEEFRPGMVSNFFMAGSNIVAGVLLNLLNQVGIPVLGAILPLVLVLYALKVMVKGGKK